MTTTTKNNEKYTGEEETNEEAYVRVAKRMVYEKLIEKSPNYELLKAKDDQHVNAVLKQFNIKFSYIL